MFMIEEERLNVNMSISQYLNDSSSLFSDLNILKIRVSLKPKGHPDFAESPYVFKELKSISFA